jgi:YidC/Oxa1 family membrane protein insertase
MIVSPLVQFPVFVSAFYALRGLAGKTGGVPYPDFPSGGLWFFTDLTQPDQTWVLPLICSGVYLLSVEVCDGCSQFVSSHSP